MLKIEHMTLFVVISVRIQLNGQGIDVSMISEIKEQSVMLSIYHMWNILIDIALMCMICRLRTKRFRGLHNSYR